MIIVECQECGKRFPHERRFHQPCDADVKTVWLSWGTGGKRVPSEESTIRTSIGEVFSINPRASLVSVHHEKCNLGVTSPRPCNCEPLAVLRPRS